MAKQRPKRREPNKPDSLDRIKKLTVIAMFSDDELMDRLVLKGGNALDLIHQLGTRASVDVDFSMEDDFKPDQRVAIRGRIERALTTTFREAGYEAFDIRMEQRPSELTPDMADFWGGYSIEFKLIEKSKFEQFSANIEALRRNALMIGLGQRFIIDISCFEFTKEKQPEDLDGYRIFVYSPLMIALEKLRAICQQMPEYGPVVKRGRPGGARARDFFDIHALVTARNLDILASESQCILAAIFQAKRVPLNLLGRIGSYREFHRADFVAVRAAIRPGVAVRPFDFYFDFVLDLVEKLKALWDV